MMRRIGTVALPVLMLFCLPTFVGAQQEAMYSQYVFNALAINPAYSGSREMISATALYRSQWVGMRGAPKTQTLSFDSPLADGKMGLGLQFFNDKIGIARTSGIYTSYAYRIKMENSTLAFGMQAGVTNYRAAYSEVGLNSGAGSDVAFKDDINAYALNVGTGVYFNTEKFYFGVSVPHLLNNRLADALSIEPQTSKYLHLFVASGYVVSLNEDYKLKPSFLIKGVKGAPLSVDLNASLWIHDIFSVGTQYRHKADIGAVMEYQISSNLRLGYSYDRSTTRLVDYNSGSHEVMLRYDFSFSKPGAVLTPRYF